MSGVTEKCTVIKNGIVLTFNKNWDMYEDGMIVIKGNKIEAIGCREDLESQYQDADRVIDAKNKAIMPGFVDLHYHPGAMKGYKTDIGFERYLPEIYYPMLRSLSEEDSYNLSMLSFMESIKGGATSANIMWSQMLPVGRAVEDIGFRATIGCSVMPEEEKLDTLKNSEELFTKMHGAADGRIKVNIGIEYVPLASVELLKETVALAQKLDVGVHVHLNEVYEERGQSMEKFGCSSIELAYDLGILNSKCIAAHCIDLNEKEIRLLKETGTTVAHNPVGNARTGVGVCPAVELLKNGVNVGIGHDLAECNNSADMFEQVKWSSLLHKLKTNDMATMPSKEALRMGTLGGSKALGNDTGVLERGKLADMIIIDLMSEHFIPLTLGEDTNIYDHLAFAANGRDVHTSIINGNIVMENYEMTTCNKVEIYEKAQKTFEHLVKKIPENIL